MAKKGSRSGSHASIQDWLKRQPAEDRPALRQSVTRLKKLYGLQRHDDFVWWHKVGSLVANLCPKEDRHYGDNVINLLAQHVEPDREPEGPRNFLYAARDLADKLSREEASELTEAGLSKSHVTALLSVEKPTQRQHFLGRCLKESWSVRRLRQEVQNAKGRKSRSGGRPVQGLERQSAGVAARNLSVMSRRWRESHQVWFVGPQAAFGRVRKKDCNEEILWDAQTALEELKQLHEVTGYELDLLHAFVQGLEEELST